MLLKPNEKRVGVSKKKSPVHMYCKGGRLWQGTDSIRVYNIVTRSNRTRNSWSTVRCYWDNDKKEVFERGYSWFGLYRCGISGGWTETSGCQLKGLVV